MGRDPSRARGSMDTIDPPRRAPFPKAWLDAERRFVARLARPPRATVALLGLLAAIHVLGGVLSSSDQGAWLRVFGIRPTEMMVRLGARDGALVADGEVWRLVSAGFLHWDTAHLFMNGLALWGLGRLCEVVFGPVRFYWLFLLCVFGGNVLSQTAHAEVVSAGASGGVFGLLGALVAFGLSRRRVLSPPLREVFTRQLFPWILLNLGIGILLPFIDNRAHIGGLITGALCALVLGDSITDDHRPWPWATIAMLGSMVLVLVWAAAMVLVGWA